jgi:hypothetical protein
MNTALLKILNDHSILYGVGGSWMLKQMGCDVNPQDMDIFVHEKDIQKAFELLSNLATLQPKIPSGPYQTQYFYRFELNGETMDVMSLFSYTHEEGTYHAIFDEESIVRHVIIDELSIPLMSMEEWFVMYHVMKRIDKIKLIDDYWKTHSLQYPELLKRQVNQGLPINLKEIIENHLKENDQAVSV